MDLTIILPSISNRELITKLKKETRQSDELLCFKVKSQSVKKTINDKISIAKHDNILIVNPRDSYALKDGFIELFRTEDTIVSNIKDDGNVSIKSSVKFNKHQFNYVPDNVRCLNVNDYLRQIYSNIGEKIIINTKQLVKKKNTIPLIYFHVRDAKIQNRGPYIQSGNKIKYFKQYIKNFNFVWVNSNKEVDWHHYLFPTEVPKGVENYSFGPNIFLRKELDSRHKSNLVVADSNFMKSVLVDKFNIPENNIYVIPVYIREEFFNTVPKLNNDKFVVGLTGYYDNDDIKNVNSLPHIFKNLPNIQFDFLSSRDQETFPKEFRECKNVNIRKVNNIEVPNVMSNWNIYLSVSKRERGPSALQEARTIGIPTITPDHTGYSEFNNSIKLPIEPYRELTKPDLESVIFHINYCIENYDYYLEKSLQDKSIFWTYQKHPKIISKLWEDFFTKCLGNY